jgi:hypothetical protein
VGLVHGGPTLLRAERWDAFPRVASFDDPRLQRDLDRVSGRHGIGIIMGNPSLRLSNGKADTVLGRNGMVGMMAPY